MMPTQGAGRGGHRMRAALALLVLVSSLLASMPAPGSFAAPLRQGSAGQEQDPCRAPAPPLLQQYDDVRNGFGLRYPDGWIWRPRSDALPGTRSEIVWFGPNYSAARASPECITTFRVAMFFLLSDSTLEQMRDATSMFDTGALLTRQVQAEVQATPSPLAGVPAMRVPRFWSQGRRSLWGAERLTLPSGHAYYREIGTGPVQDLELRERQGSIVRYVIAVSPRAALEIVGEATTPEFETQYARLFDQVVQTLRVRDEVSPHAGPVGVSAEPGACQALILVNEVGRGATAAMPQRPFLERGAVAERLELRGWALPVNTAALDGAAFGQAPDEGCGPIRRLALFLEEPTAGADYAVHDVSVYGLTYPDPPPMTEQLDPAAKGYYLSWAIPKDTYGQRVVYIAAEMADGRWSWVTRQVNVAPPLSVVIEVTPPQVEIGERVRVVMQVLNNTSATIIDVRPILMPTGGSGVVLLRSGPVAQPCDLQATPAARLPAPTTAGPEAAAPAAPVQLRPYGDRQGSCALFFWEFTALRSGSLSFSGTAEGRRQAMMQSGGALRLLSAGESASLRGQVAGPPGAGDEVSAPITTATDVRVRAAVLEVQRPIVLPDVEDPRRVVAWVPVVNAGGSDLYNVQIMLDVRGVRALPSPLVVAGEQVAETAYLREGRVCTPGLGRQLIQDLEARLQPGDTLSLLRRDECVTFVRAFEVMADESLEQPFFVEARVRATTPQAGSQDVGGGLLPAIYPEAQTQAGPFTVDRLQDLVPVRLRRLPREVAAVEVAQPTPGPGAGPVSETGGGGAGGSAGGGQPRLEGDRAVFSVVPQAQPTSPIPGVGQPTPAPGATPGPARRPGEESGQLVVKLEARNASSQDAIVFREGDTIRVTMLVRNETGLPLRNVRPTDLSVNGQRPTDIFAVSTPVPVIQIPQLGGAGQTPNAPPPLLPPPPPPGGEVTFCVIQGPPGIGGVVNQIRQLSGPVPPEVSRLAPGQTATFTWEFLIQQYRDNSPQLIFTGGAQGEFAGDVIASQPVSAEPVERAIGCVFVTLTASPANVQPGDVIEVTMRAHNNNQFFPPRVYRDVFPTQLQVLVDPPRGNETVDVSLQTLSGPSNIISSGSVNLYENEVTYFRWRFRVNGHGCFRLRGQLGAHPVRSNVMSFFSNNVESNRVCTPPGPRQR